MRETGTLALAGCFRRVLMLLVLGAGWGVTGVRKCGLGFKGEREVKQLGEGGAHCKFSKERGD